MSTYRMITRLGDYHQGPMSAWRVLLAKRNGWREVTSWDHEPTEDEVQDAARRDILQGEEGD